MCCACCALLQAIKGCTSLDDMHQCRAKYLRAVTRYCLLRCVWRSALERGCMDGAGWACG